MEYFEIDKDNPNETKSKRKNKKFNLKYLFGIIVIFMLLFSIIINFLIKEEKNPIKENKKENKKITENNTIKQNLNKYNLELIKKSPFLYTQYILDIIDNYNNLDLTIFKKNINTIKQRIYSIINNKKENEDMYKILSTIYGAFLADSMGSFCEFKSFNKNNHLSIFNDNVEYNRIFKPGQVTDDSEMAMSQSYAIMDNNNYKSINQHLFFYYYIVWYNSHPLDMGITTRSALSTLKLDKNSNITNDIIFSEKIKNFINRQNYHSLANGLLMRISPLLSWFYIINKKYISNILETKSNEKYYELYKKIYIEVEKDSQLTHPNKENAVAGSIFIFMGLCSMEQKYSGKQILEMIKILFENNNFDINKEENILKTHYTNILKEIEKRDFVEDIYFGDLTKSMGYYLHAYKLTLYYLYIFDDMKNGMNIKNIYNKIMYSICDFGGDTDTNAAIVGMILGPLIGLENFDNKYLDTFLSFYSKSRLLYTNVFMYFYAKYLIDISNISNISTNNPKINFNFYKMIDEMLNKQL